jgi:hypothetical protein
VVLRVVVVGLAGERPVVGAAAGALIREPVRGGSKA